MFRRRVPDFNWRPISEMTDERGECVLMELLSTEAVFGTGNAYDTSPFLGWTHFAQIGLSTECAEALLKAMKVQNE